MYSDSNGVRDDRDHAGRAVFRNYAREYVLSDGTMGVDHAKTRNSAPIHIDRVLPDTTVTPNITDLSGYL